MATHHTAPFTYTVDPDGTITLTRDAAGPLGAANVLTRIEYGPNNAPYLEWGSAVHAWREHRLDGPATIEADGLMRWNTDSTLEPATQWNGPDPSVIRKIAVSRAHNPLRH